MAATKTKRTPKPGSWAADTVERYAITKLVPYAKNARIHSEDQIDRIAKSITEFGFTQPVLIDENDMIIAGHGRVLAAARLGLTNIPVIRAKKWSDAQKRAYVIADNRIAETSEWDMGLLLEEAQGLLDMDYDLELAGIDDDFLTLDDFKPELAPTTDRLVVDAQAVEKAKQALDGQIDSAKQDRAERARELICPHCGEEFSVEGF